MIPSANEINALTLTQLTTIVGNAIRLRPELQQAWVTAELSDVRASGGHCYMELVEKNERGQTLAKLRANIWNSTFRVVNRKFHEATGRNISTGLKVMVRGSVTHHPLYGMSFNIVDIDPSYTLGDIERLRREILQRLQAEGIADVNRSLLLPEAPQRIAVISATGAAGYGDFCNQLENNADGFVFYPRLFPAVLQGERTAPSVLEALDAIQTTAHLWDAVVIIRGGGATTDLIGFDNLELARRVATFPIPIIVGIGHERDNTVLDYIANTRCKTPTAVAEHLVNRLREAATRVGDALNYIIRYSSQRVQGEQRRLTTGGAMISTLAGSRLSKERARLESIPTSIPLLLNTRFKREEVRLETLMRTLSVNNGSATRVGAQRLESLKEQLQSGANIILSRCKEELQRYSELVNALSPDATLRRGYSLTTDSAGRVVKSVERLRTGEVLNTHLADGKLEVTINRITDRDGE